MWNKPESYWKPSQRYSHPDDWTFGQWAWEFLRRNTEYQNDCIAVEGGPAFSRAHRAAETARKWGLRNLKPFKENYGYGTDCDWLSLKPKHHAAVEKKRKIDLSLECGQVALIFDLNECLPNSSALDVQLAQAKVWLDSWLYAYAQSRQQLPKSESVQKGKLFAYLRILDAFALESPPATIDLAKALLTPGQLEDEAYAQRMISKMKGRATKLTQTGYRGWPPKDKLRYRPIDIPTKIDESK
jgi:hypothetical protein